MKVIPKLIVKNLSKTYNYSNALKGTALDSVSLSVKEEEFVSVIGQSGCGKSTLLDCIAGLTNPNEGDILIDNNSILKKRGKVSYMMQDDVMFPWRTVLDNITVPLELSGVRKVDARKKVWDHLQTFGLSDFALHYPFSLSGGMRQRASLLRTYLFHKEVMLLDEPFGKLDALTRMKLHEWFLTVWQKQRISVLFVTHDVDEAILLSDRIYVMSPRPGKILAELQIKLKRPRKLEVETSDKFLRIKRKILGLLSPFPAGNNNDL